MIYHSNFKQTGGEAMKKHKFWGWEALFCMIMLVYTGYEHK